MKIANILYYSFIIVLAGLLTLTTIAQDTQQDDTPDLDEQPLLMTFIPNIQFAPFYVAIEGGYFADEGLDVSLDYLDEPDVVDLVAAGQNAFGVVSGEQVILAAANDRPIQFVYAWFQEYPIGIVYDSELAIDTPADLDGLTIGIPGRFGASYTGFTTLVQSAALSEQDITLDEIGFNAPEAFCVGAVRAAVVYVNNEPLQIQNRIQAGDCGAVESVDVLPVSEVANLVSNGIITNENTIENNPELVSRMVRAFDNGMRVTVENPARAYLLSAPFIEGLPLTDDLVAALEALAAEQDTFLESDYTQDELFATHEAMYQTLSQDFDADTLIQFRVLLETIPLIYAERLGETNLQAWQNMEDTLISLGLLDNDAAIDVEVLFTNEFLPEQDN